MARYEQLRERALAGDAGGWRCGLAILQHRGMVAWLHAWRPLVPAPPDASADRTAVPAPASAVADRLVQALASMALAVAGR